MTWTRFMDMHSGGRTKVAPYDKILVEMPEPEARAWFQRVLNRDPDHVTCSCCGEDYSVSESATLDHATAYDRGCDWDKAAQNYVERPSKYCDKVMTVEEYAAKPDVLVVRADELEKAVLS